MISGVILAAGSSTRLGRPKQLLDLHGEPLLRHVVHNAIASKLDDVVLVLGCDAEHIADAIGEWGQRVVINPDYADGQSTSLRHGLANIDPQAEAVLFLLGDQPGVTPDIINTVLARFRETGGPIVAPTYGGKRGNPILFSRQFFPDLARITGDQGARAIVRAHQNDVVTVPVSDGQPPQDVDTDADYAALLTSM
jgi:molybdenum cofactor cytidylyltransferase